MFENVLEVAESPDELIVYASLGKAARSWPDAHAIVNALLELDEAETLVLASGAPVGVLSTGTPAATPGRSSRMRVRGTYFSMSALHNLAFRWCNTWCCKTHNCVTPKRGYEHDSINPSASQHSQAPCT